MSVERRVVPLGVAQGGEFLEVTRTGRTATVVVRCPNGALSEMVFQDVETVTNRNAEGMVVERLIEDLVLGGALPSRFVFESQDGSRSLAITAKATVSTVPGTARSWRAIAESFLPDARFADPAKSQALDEMERALGVPLPEDLAAFLRETDGLQAHAGTPVVWGVAEMLAQNRAYRDNRDFATLYMPFDCLLFFGAAGNGDLFGFRILDKTIPPTSGVYLWDHESDSRSWFAGDLEDYLRRIAAA